MRTASYEVSGGALAALLNTSTQVFMADLFTFLLPDKTTVLRYTSADTSVTFNGATYLLGPTIKRGKTALTVGIATDTLDLNVAADSTVTVGGVPMLNFIAAGGLDNARMVLSRAFKASPTDATWVGTLDLFSGRVSDCDIDRYEASISVVSDSELLDVMVPRNVYQPGCSNTLFDGACGLSKTAYENALTALTATDVSLTTWNLNIQQTSGYFALGWAVCATGANAGVSRTIKSWTPVSAGVGTAQTVQPWPFAVGIGDTFKVYPGCEKTQATCSGKFSNLIRFRGFPYIPAPETVI